MDMIRCKWQNNALHPTGNYGIAAAHEMMTEGDTVLVTIDHPRSTVSHDHQFASIHDMWRHIPESLQDEPWAANPDTMRKHALIVTGFHDTYQIDCGKNATAERVKKALEAAEVGKHGYALAQVRGPVVSVWTPKSQSMRAMGGEEFQRSKTEVLAWIEGKIGATADQVRGAA